MSATMLICFFMTQIILRVPVGVADTAYNSYLTSFVAEMKLAVTQVT